MPLFLGIYYPFGLLKRFYCILSRREFDTRSTLHIFVIQQISILSDSNPFSDLS